jgi:hypothetical protein
LSLRHEKYLHGKKLPCLLDYGNSFQDSNPEKPRAQPFLGKPPASCEFASG